MKIEGPDIKETIQDSFRQWYMEHKRIHGKFPEFPEDEVWQKPGFQFIPPVEGRPITNNEQAAEETKGKNSYITKPKNLVKTREKTRKEKMMR